MSYDVSSHVVIGVMFEDLVREETKAWVTEAKKYNPDTGAPYMETIQHRETKYFIGNRELPGPIEHIAELRGAVQGWLYHAAKTNELGIELELHDVSEIRTAFDDNIIGLQLTDLSGNGGEHFEDVGNLGDLGETFNTVNGALRRLGCSEPARLFHILVESC